MRKNVVRGYKMFDAADVSTNQTSSEVNVINLDKASIYLDWTGSSPVGVITVQARNDEKDTWFDLDFGAAISISGSTGSHVLIFNELPHNTIRLLYTSTSGSGALDAILAAKQVGG